MSSDVESEDYQDSDLRKSYDLPNDEDINEHSVPITPPRAKLVRRLTHDNIETDELNSESTDVNFDNEELTENEKPNYNTFKVSKAKKSSKLQSPQTNVSRSPVRNNVVTASGDSSPKLSKRVTNCSLEAEKEMESLLRSENVNLHKQIENNNQVLEDMRRCVIEYESTIKELKESHDFQITEKIGTINNLICERDQAVQDLNTIEKAFTDLQRRFEKSKEVIDNLHKNQNVLKKHSESLKEELMKSETKYSNLKILTERRLKKANEEIDYARRENEGEIARLNAVAKKAELKIVGLETQLNQKVVENQGLTKICDELISKYSGIDS